MRPFDYYRENIEVRKRDGKAHKFVDLKTGQELETRQNVRQHCRQKTMEETN